LPRTACPNDQIISATAEAFLNKTPGPGFPDGTSLEDGYCAQAKYLGLLEEKLGAWVGYKAGLTNKPLQDRFGATEPVGGVVFESMLLPSGTEIETDIVVRLVYEADLIVTVTDERINEARTPEEVIPHLGEVIPFVGLLDLLIAEGEPLNLATIVGYNVCVPPWCDRQGDSHRAGRRFY
jgi:2-oxo-hept-3-ene-1,7-dioate hydratase